MWRYQQPSKALTPISKSCQCSLKSCTLSIIYPQTVLVCRVVIVAPERHCLGHAYRSGVLASQSNFQSTNPAIQVSCAYFIIRYRFFVRSVRILYSCSAPTLRLTGILSLYSQINWSVEAYNKLDRLIGELKTTRRYEYTALLD